MFTNHMSLVAPLHRYFPSWGYIERQPFAGRVSLDSITDPMKGGFMRFLANNKWSFIAVAVILFTTGGCATLADAQRARGTGKSKIYNVSSERIYHEIQSVVDSVGLAYAGENRKEGYVLAQRSMSLFSAGENVAIFIEPQGDDKTRVEVVSKKSVATNIFAPDWTDPIFEELDKRF